MRQQSVFLARLRPWLAVALIAAMATASAGDLYQWKDAKGVTHYSDSPPPNQPYTSRKFRNHGDAAVSEPKVTESAPCVTARMNLQHLQGGAAVGFDTNNDGKADVTFSAAERATQTGRAVAAVQAHCTAPTLTQD